MRRSFEIRARQLVHLGPRVVQKWFSGGSKVVPKFVQRGSKLFPELVQHWAARFARRRLRASSANVVHKWFKSGSKVVPKLFQRGSIASGSNNVINMTLELVRTRRVIKGLSIGLKGS